MTDKEWTIMIYMAGDNNLSEDMITAINGIKSGHKPDSTGKIIISPDDKVAFLAEYDSQHPIVKTRRYDFTKLESEQEISNSPEPTSAKAIESFVKWGVKQQPAENYALIISGHSDAFQGNTLLLDEDPSGVTTIQQLKESLQEIVKNLPKKKLDILAFDSCVMNTFEVIYELREIAGIWVGSQGSIPNYTWDYENIVKGINQKMTGEEIVEIIVKSVKKYNKSYAFAGRSIDISGCLLDTPKMNGVLSAIKNLADKLRDCLIAVPELTKIGHSTDNVSEFTVNYNFCKRLLLNVHLLCQTYMREQSIDICDFCFCLTSESSKIITETLEICDAKFISDFNKLKSISEKIEFIKSLKDGSLSAKAQEKIISSLEICDCCNQLVEAVDAFIKKGAFTGSGYQFSNGVSLFFPWSLLALKMSFKEYEKLGFFNTDEGRSWTLLLIIYAILTSRLPESYSLPKIFASKFFAEGFADKTFLLKLFEEGGAFRDDPKRTRGTSEYNYYFGQTKNVFPELDIEGDFPKI